MKVKTSASNIVIRINLLRVTVVDRLARVGADMRKLRQRNLSLLLIPLAYRHQLSVVHSKPQIPSNIAETSVQSLCVGQGGTWAMGMDRATAGGDRLKPDRLAVAASLAVFARRAL